MSKSSKIPSKTKSGKYPINWDLSPMFKSENDPVIKVKLDQAKKLHLDFIKKWQANKEWLTNPKTLAKVLGELNELSAKGGLTAGFGYFLFLANSLDENSKSLKGKLGQLKDFVVPIENDLEFFTNELSKIPAATQTKFLAAPELKNYRHWLIKLFEVGKHVLTIAEEKILNLEDSPARDSWKRMMSNLLASELAPAINEKGQKVDATLEELISLNSSTKKKVRDTSSQALNNMMAKYAPVAEHEINALLDHKKISDQLRGFTRPDQSRHLADDIDSAAVDIMLKTVSRSFKTANKFYELKAKLLKVKKLEYHERNVPVGELTTTFNYDASVDLVHKVLTNLDPEFGQIFMGFVKNKQIDVYPRQNKSGGAFCTYDLPQFPTYILLNHTDRLQSVKTLAHEVGHGINDELIKKVQPAHYFNTPLSTAEVASTFMEDFVIEELSKNISDEERLTLYMAKLGDEVSTIFRQVACYQFEQKLHTAFRAKGYLGQEEIGQMFQTAMKSYMGKAINYYPGSENWWVYWSHIRSFFYVYSYASGLIISKALQAKVRADKNFIKEVKYFLSAGTSDSPVNIFKNIGLDITKEQFWQTGLDEIDQLLAKTVKLAKKLKKI